MNLSEANAVNRLLDWLLDVGDLDQDETAGDAADAAAFLAGRAHRVLHAGLTEQLVREAWPSPCADPSCSCTDDEPPPRPVTTIVPAAGRL